jgi:hypothetical protein
MSYIEEYRNKMLAEKNANQLLDVFNDNSASTSKVSIWRNFIYIVAFLANNLKELFELFKVEVQTLLDNQIITNLEYYRNLLFEYRDGHTFNRESLIYEGDYTDEQIETSKIIKRVAVQAVRVENVNTLYVKLATEDNTGKLVKLNQETLERIEDYIFVNSNAVQIVYFSEDADKLRLEINVYVDASILSLEGARIDGTENTPVPDAINAFLEDKNFKFDGELILAKLVNAIQEVEGVENEAVRVVKAEASFKVIEEFVQFKERYTAQSGYYELTEENLKINYLVK